MIALGDVAVMGGGCYGSFYLKQLVIARAKGALTFRRVLIVDHDAACQAAAAVVEPGCEVVVADWNDFLDGYLDPAARGDHAANDMVVPTPLMPHLMADWLVRRARQEWPDRVVELVAAETPMGTPYDRLHTDKVRYVSFADWICPTHCIEPRLCPAIGAPRTWEMRDTVIAWSAAHAKTRPIAPPAFFQCAHVAYGVGMYPAGTAADALAALRPMASSANGADQVIGSISACHGAVAVLRVGAA
ncbi:MAG TPA: hypothetical protein VGM77_11480 [Gemmatimonadales bacterium]